MKFLDFAFNNPKKHYYAAFLTSQLREINWGHWIGFHYISREDKWVWSDNSEPNFSFWAPGQHDGAVSIYICVTWCLNIPKPQSFIFV